MKKKSRQKKKQSTHNIYVDSRDEQCSSAGMCIAHPIGLNYENFVHKTCAVLSKKYKSGKTAVLPFYADVFGVCGSGFFKAWLLCRIAAVRIQGYAVQSIRKTRIRPRAGRTFFFT